jgi:hypothetical protein
VHTVCLFDVLKINSEPIEGLEPLPFFALASRARAF